MKSTASGRTPTQATRSRSSVVVHCAVPFVLGSRRHRTRNGARKLSLLKIGGLSPSKKILELKYSECSTLLYLLSDIDVFLNSNIANRQGQKWVYREGLKDHLS